MVSTKHVSASLRVLDSERNGVRTFTGVRRALTNENVLNLLNGLNEIRIMPVTNAVHTVRAELVSEL